MIFRLFLHIGSTYIQLPEDIEMETEEQIYDYMQKLMTLNELLIIKGARMVINPKSITHIEMQKVDYMKQQYR
jgi:hypothetical protein